MQFAEMKICLCADITENCIYNNLITCLIQSISVFLGISRTHMCLYSNISYREMSNYASVFIKIVNITNY